MAAKEPEYTLRVERLRLAMRAAGITTNAELARRMGTVSESTVSRLLNKDYVPNANIIFGLHKVFPLLTLEELYILGDGHGEQDVA